MKNIPKAKKTLPPSFVTSRDVNRDGVLPGAVLENFSVYLPRRVTFKCKPRQRRELRGRSSSDEIFAKRRLFGSNCLR